MTANCRPIHSLTTTRVGWAKRKIELEWLAAGGTFKQDHAWILHQYNLLAKLPPVAWGGKMQELKDELMASPPSPLSQWHYAIIAGNWGFLQRRCDQLSCAVAGLGVERFRLKHGRWPDSLEEVVAAKLLDKVPTDVQDGKPLHYRKTVDGAVVFWSAGENTSYAGDAVETGRLDVRFREFRLWDEAKRRQPPPK